MIAHVLIENAETYYLMKEGDNAAIDRFLSRCGICIGHRASSILNLFHKEEDNAYVAEVWMEMIEDRSRDARLVPVIGGKDA